MLPTVAAPSNAHIVPAIVLLSQDPEFHASARHLSISHPMAEVLVEAQCRLESPGPGSGRGLGFELTGHFQAKVLDVGLFSCLMLLHDTSLHTYQARIQASSWLLR